MPVVGLGCGAEQFKQERKTETARKIAPLPRLELFRFCLFSWPWLGLYCWVGCWACFFLLCRRGAVRLVASQGHEKTRHKGRAVGVVWCYYSLSVEGWKIAFNSLNLALVGMLR